MDRHFVDGAAALGVIGTLLGYMPEVAALFSIIWFSMQMYYKVKESKEKKLREQLGKKTRKTDLVEEE